MTDRSEIVSMEDLTSEEIDRLMRLARRERSIMAHKIMRTIYTTFSTTLRNVISTTARRLAKTLSSSQTPTPGSEGVSHV